MPTQYFLETVAVTGATGFIGSHLVHALIAAGCSPVIFTGSPKNIYGNQKFDGKLRSFELDLTDSDSVRDVLMKEKPVTLFHLAGTRGKSDRGQSGRGQSGRGQSDSRDAASA